MEKKKNKFGIFGKNRNRENWEEILTSRGIVLTPYKDGSPEAKKELRFYMDSIIFTEQIRKYEHKYPFKKAIKLAIKYCMERNILKEYLKENSSKTLNMMLKARADYEAGVITEESRRKFMKEFE